MDLRINEWSALDYVDPVVVLPQLRKLQVQVADSDIEDRIKNLRTHKLKQHRERWEAAIFCFGMSKLIDVPVYVASYEASDYDAVAKRIEGDSIIYTPIQIKEVVPEDLNSETDLTKEIAKLKRYPVSNDTAIVIHVNRAGRLHLPTIKVPSLNVGSLWLFGALSPDQSKWFIAGNLLNVPTIFEFDYPA